MSERRTPDLRLAEAVREAIKARRRHGAIPTELRLSQDAWNGLSPEMRFGPFGGRRVMLFEGLPCVLVVGLKDPKGFVVQTIEPRD
jgi:hypothetical protein